MLPNAEAWSEERVKIVWLRSEQRQSCIYNKSTKELQMSLLSFQMVITQNTDHTRYLETGVKNIKK